MNIAALDFKNLTFVVLAAMIVIIMALIFCIIVVNSRVSACEKKIRKVESETSFVEATCESLATADYDHTRKIKSLNSRFVDISTRVREIEKSLYEASDDAK